MPPTVYVFTVPNCTQCDSTKEQLKKYDIKNVVIVPARDTEGAAEFIAGLGQMKMPMVLVYEGDWRDFQPTPETEGDFWYGYQPHKIWKLRKQLEAVAA